MTPNSVSTFTVIRIEGADLTPYLFDIVHDSAAGGEDSGSVNLDP